MTIHWTGLQGQFRGTLLALAALLAAVLLASAETPPEKADALLAGVIKTNDPGLTVLVAQDGKILFEKGYGLADRKHHVPVPGLHKLHYPVLAIFGGSDQFVPVQKSAEIWKRALAKAGNHDVVVKIFPHAGHAMNDMRTWAPVPGFYALVRDWLLKHVTIPRSRL